MQTLKIFLDKGVIEDYYYTTTMDETNTSIGQLSQNLRGPYCTSTFTSKFLSLQIGEM